MIMLLISRGLLGPLAFFLLLSCSPKKTETKPLSSPLAEAGRISYQSNCIACHNPDPKLDGSVGPAVHGSSPALIHAKLMTGNYPKGYKAKRGTKLMPPMTFLSEEIEALTAFLNEP